MTLVITVCLNNSVAQTQPSHNHFAANLQSLREWTDVLQRSLLPSGAAWQLGIAILLHAAVPEKGMQTLLPVPNTLPFLGVLRLIKLL